MPRKVLRRMSQKANSSYFITFEGGEGAGKTTLIKSLKRILEEKGHLVVQTREPGGSILSEKIRDLLLHRDKNLLIGNRAELLLFLSARAEHVEEVIKPALDSGKIVLCDRFSDSSVAYQGYARGLGMEEVEGLSSFATGGVIPDLTFFLDLDPAVGLARASKSRALDAIEQEKAEFHARVREGFIKIAELNPERVKLIDASQNKNQVLNQALSYIKV